MAELGNSLRERREAAGLTQAELAERIGVSRKTVNTVENAVFVPSTVIALKLAAALNCTVEELFFLTSDANRPESPADQAARDHSSGNNR